ncbi:MAG: bacterial proteasome activator family protein [Acidimicrobiia bacterium]|nr:bacterial proteasome activator family protein [Acidimicrobiia bacterium]
MTDNEMPQPEVLEADESEADQPLVSEPLKLVRIASMTQAMLVEVRGIDLDEHAVARLQGVHGRTVASLREIMSDELREELDAVVLPLQEGASEAEVRVAQAQLAGWLEGLFHGIRASLWGQQVAVQRAAMQNLEALHTLDSTGAPVEESGSGPYL